MARNYRLVLMLICTRTTKTYHERTDLSEIINMFCLTVLYLDNFEVPTFIKVLHLGQRLNPQYKIYGFLEVSNQCMSFWLSSFSEIWDIICATEEYRTIQPLKHKMLHLGHFMVMILMMQTEMNAQIHNDNYMFSKRL